MTSPGAPASEPIPPPPQLSCKIMVERVAHNHARTRRGTDCSFARHATDSPPFAIHSSLGPCMRYRTVVLACGTVLWSLHAVPYGGP